MKIFGDVSKEWNNVTMKLFDMNSSDQYLYLWLVVLETQWWEKNKTRIVFALGPAISAGECRALKVLAHVIMK